MTDMPLIPGLPHLQFYVQYGKMEGEYYRMIHIGIIITLVRDCEYNRYFQSQGKGTTTEECNTSPYYTPTNVMIYTS